MRLRSLETSMSERVERALALHFDPEGGSPYWLRRQLELGIDARREIASIQDLSVLGPMDEHALSNLPFEEFVPRSVLRRRCDLIVAETAGTLGQPKFAVHHRWEFHTAFIEPFIVAAHRINFPRELNWLFIGPSGPHIIGKAARACAAAMGSADPFTIDFDPRWAKKQPPGTLGWKRYLNHVENQSLAILQRQRIGVIFSTPIVLQSLAERLNEDQRLAIRGIHLGGMSVSGEQRQCFAEHFPNSIILSGFGNTLFGMMPELKYSREDGIDYFPLGRRLIIRTIEPEGDDASDRLRQDVSAGQRGQVVISRIDHTQLIVNLMERDTAILMDPPDDAAEDGFVLPGLRDPQPIINQTLKPSLGLY